MTEVTDVIIDKEPVVNKQIVAYFDHEFKRPTAQKIDADLTAMQDNGFTHVVLTMSESDISSESRMQVVKTISGEASARDLGVWLDPWNVGGVFGGEAKSHFEEGGETRCYCNPKIGNLMNRWLGAVAELGVNTVFWDEPEMKCDDHKNKGHELPFLEKNIEAAGRLALASVVVLPADERRAQQLIDVAALPDVVEIATDPYYPNAFNKEIGEAGRIAYVEKWARRTRDAADAVGIASHGWVQNFDIPKAGEAMIGEHLTIIKDIIGSVAVWGYGGCESIAKNVPGFRKPSTLLPMQHWNPTLQFLSNLRTEERELVA